MAKFEKGDWVSFSRPQNTVGRVVARHGNKYRIFTISGEQVEHGGKGLRGATRAALILESNLSKGKTALRSDHQRRSGVYLEELFRSMGLLVYREKIHTVADLEFFLKQARNQKVCFVHYCGHGSHERESALNLSIENIGLPRQARDRLVARLENKRGPRLRPKVRRQLNEDLKKYEQVDKIFGNGSFNGQIVVFSACEVGKEGGLAQYVSGISGAKAVIAYDDEVNDDQTNVAEAVLYWKLVYLQNKASPPAALIRQLRKSSRSTMGWELPIVCYQNGEKAS